MFSYCLCQVGANTDTVCNCQKVALGLTPPPTLAEQRAYDKQLFRTLFPKPSPAPQA